MSCNECYKFGIIGGIVLALARVVVWIAHHAFLNAKISLGSDSGNTFDSMIVTWIAWERACKLWALAYGQIVLE